MHLLLVSDQWRTTYKKGEQTIVRSTAKKSILDYAHNNLADLTLEYVRHHVVKTVLPDFISKAESDEAKYLGAYYIEHPPSITTVWRWMRRLGFKYDTRKKSFYVDGHERPEQRFHRARFCEEYLTKLEPFLIWLFTNTFVHFSNIFDIFLFRFLISS